MNTIKYFNSLICGIAFLSFTSCDYLDKEPFDLITPDQVWEDPKLINGVLVNLYDKMQLEDFNYRHYADYQLVNLTTMSDEAQGSFQKDPVFDNGNATYAYADDLFGTFADPYKGIRNCNDFLAQLKEALLDEAEKASLEAEVRFIRAWHYFTLVKRYGGVPIIMEPQEYNGADQLESLQLPRSKEEEVYNFIIDECNAIAENLPLQRDASGKYRADKGAALALCSRAALYAGSIAKYGTVQLDGIVGIPTEKANHFYQIAYDASKKVMDLGVYALYLKKPDDRAQNYCDMFLKGNGDNGEYIFQKQYNVAGGKGHDFDKRNAPFSFRAGGWGCGAAPTLEMVEEYEYLDGSEGTLVLTNPDGSARAFDDPMELFANKDPRLFASVYLPGSPCKGDIVEWRRGIINSNGEKIQATKQPDAVENYVDPSTGITYNVSGKDGGADAGDPSKTGFYQKKFWDETLTDLNMGKSETPRPVFRLAEMYLNLAEAAVEMGEKEQEALNAINAIRERAGIAKQTSIDIQKVRHERKVELAFEGHRYWDMRRWRIAHLDVAQGGLNGFRGSALYPWLDTRTQKYVFERGNKPPKQVRLFLEKNYYVKIGSDDMNSNPKLVQNPGYTN